MTMVMRASPEARTRVKGDEGLRTLAYKDTVGKWTIGYGHAETNPIPVRGLRVVYQKTEAGQDLRDPITGKLIPVMDEFGKPVLEFYTGKVCEGVQITAVEAERLFDADMDETERGISELVTQDLSQNQCDALVDFVHQYGLHNLATSTLLLKINFNPNSPAVLDQFMRWTMAGGEHQEYVWRRSARRSILYNGTPCPQGLYSKNGFPFVVDPVTDHIDYSVTPTIQKLIEIGKKKAEPYVFDPSKINIEAPSDSGVAVDNDQPVGGNSPAQNPEPATKATAGPDVGVGAQGLPSPTVAPIAPPPDPTIYVTPEQPVLAPRAKVESGAGKPVPPPTPPKPPAGPVFIPVGTKPIHPETKMPEVIPYRIDPKAGAKPLESTERFLGSVLILLGTLLRTTMANGFKLSGPLGILAAWILTLMKDPVTMAIFVSFLAMAVTGIGWGIGRAIQKSGIKKKRRGEETATQLMY